MANRIFGLIIISILLILIDIYIYRAIRSVSWKWKGQKHLSFTYIWWGYTFLLIAGVFISIFFNIKFLLRSIILVVFFLTFVSKIFILPFLITDDLRRLMVWISRKLKRKESTELNKTNAIPRSEFLIKAGTLVAAIPLASLTYGVVSSAYDYRVKRKTLYLPNLPKAFDGIKLGQLSDIHSGSFYDRKAVIGGVDMLLKEKPDMVFFTGDLVNNVASEMYDYQDIFSKVKAPLGVFSVLGNHDYGDYHYGQGPSAAKIKNLADVKQTHKNMGWDLLLNENRRLKIDGDEIAILGIENWGVGRFAKYGRMDLAVKDTDDVPVKLLLSHDPSHWRAQVLPEYPQIDAMFSGHTHGMQFGLVTDNFQWSPAQYVYKEWAGHYKEGLQQLYVNVGYGFLGYPGRVGILPEITIFELRRGDS
ncbi:MAG: metallophosphatase [Sphingobacteriales bacterium 17-39-43]|uniref:metallophosphoesterase n=1 Tax=Daejeonella sp. TaxID=2805397 RepID=UPI000BDB097A|nr:metallophosphoesterase [Daejeonella sp.]OYZ31079.1 MAG: metallophosphatase [Sphingobacteriales bacterium 16-39-50]OZA23920.1 MAG: metallophosphatase [Sphingobacteriales bacterium 17-39-43]HQT23326.1 metallophosphoesterase [Daejeonella sp.]HQT58278.1 metallophosphoesterase [Daejeonella sp.]